MGIKSKFNFKLNRAYCKSCGLCYGLCPRDALSKGEGGVPDFSAPEKCIGCMLCEMRCPDFAIRIGREDV